MVGTFSLQVSCVIPYTWILHVVDPTPLLVPRHSFCRSPFFGFGSCTPVPHTAHYTFPPLVHGSTYTHLPHTHTPFTPTHHTHTPPHMYGSFGWFFLYTLHYTALPHHTYLYIFLQHSTTYTWTYIWFLVYWFPWMVAALVLCLAHTTPTPFTRSLRFSWVPTTHTYTYTPFWMVPTYLLAVPFLCPTVPTPFIWTFGWFPLGWFPFLWTFFGSSFPLGHYSFPWFGWFIPFRSQVIPHRCHICHHTTTWDFGAFPGFTTPYYSLKHGWPRFGAVPDLFVHPTLPRFGTHVWFHALLPSTHHTYITHILWTHLDFTHWAFSYVWFGELPLPTLPLPVPVWT